MSFYMDPESHEKLMYNTNCCGFKDFVDNIEPELKDEGLITLYQIFEMRQKKQRKLNKILNKQSKYVWITIQTFKQKLNDLDKYKQFIKNIKYLYSEGYYCLESGSVPPPNCNLHLHMLVKIIQPKKHKYKLDIEFKKIFNMSIYDKDYYCLKQHIDSPKMVPYDQWIQEKLDYMDDEKKGNHNNSIDLNCRGDWGVVTGGL